MAEGLYVYCLARASLAQPLSAKGLDGQGLLRLQTFRNIAAIWSPVALEEFCGPQAEDRLKDLSWIGLRACRHEEVVEEVMGLSPVLPARFGTIFSSLEKLGELLERRHDIISAFLDRVQGHKEWALKGVLDRAAAKKAFFSENLAREAERLACLTPGSRYFEEQRLKAAADKQLAGWLRDLGRQMTVKLEELGLSIGQRRSLPLRDLGHDQEVVFNWALLIPQNSETAFTDWVEACGTLYGSRGLHLECTGPWPPYSFSPSLGLELEV